MSKFRRASRRFEVQSMISRVELREIVREEVRKELRWHATPDTARILADVRASMMAPSITYR